MRNNQPPSANGTNGRGAAGRFAPGNAFGKGNPFARQCSALRSAFMNALTVEEVADVARHLLQRARQGDLAAIKLVLAYAIGPPGTAPATDTSEADEMKLESERLRTARILEIDQTL